MKNIQKNTWFLISFGIVLITAIYIFYFVSIGRYMKITTQLEQRVMNNSIYFERPKLKIFDEDMRYINEFPDRVVVHNNYFLVVVPEAKKDITTVYDTIRKRKIASFPYVAIDFDGKHSLYSKDGINTFFDTTDLHIRCSEGVIKSPTLLFCITPNADNPQANSVVSINPKTGGKTTVYSSENYLEAINVMNGNLYIGEKNLQTGDSFLTVNGRTITTQTSVEVIYPIGNRVYFATRSDRFSNNPDVYYEIQNINDQVTTKLIGKGRIVFYEENSK